MPRSVLAAAVSGVSLLSFPRRRKVLDSLVDVVVRVEGSTRRVGAGARTAGAASIWTLMLDSVEPVPASVLNDGDADKAREGGLNRFLRSANSRLGLADGV
jgi:hypothetical protein